MEKLKVGDKVFAEIYNENRIRLSFEAAKILANECVIAKVLSDNYR